MSKKLLIGTAIIVVSGILLALASLSYHFYFLFSNSHQLFKLRHNHFQHLEIHTDTWSYEPGDSLHIYASSAPAKQAQLRCFSFLEKDTLFSETISIPFQEVEGRVSVSGTGWKRNRSFSIPPETKSGWYVLRVENERFQKNTSIFITPKTKQVKKKVAILLSTNTWNAYNHWGGQSLYSKNKAQTISFNRPQLLADPFIQNTYPNQQLYYQAANIDRPLAQLLYDNQIEFDVYPIDEIHRSTERLLKYQTLILSTHPEYWTAHMLHNLNTVLDSGRNLINLGGNTAAWHSYLDFANRELRVDKKEENLWRLKDSTGLRPFGLEETAYGFHSFGPYQVLADTSFLWEGMNIGKGDFFGEYSETYDYAYAYSGKWELLLSLFRKGTLGAASGMELDKVYPGTPNNWISLARGYNQQWDGAGKILRIADAKQLSEEPRGADMGYYRHPGGGIVFQTGSLAFCGAIPYDEKIRQIILNVVRKMEDDGR